MEPSDVSIEQERTIHMADHEVLLAFRGDDMAEMFCDWWCSKGIAAFVKYANRAAEKGGER
jgi:hypothetical protein